jgi:predicted ATPase/class 3 adenylate cyclase
MIRAAMRSDLPAGTVTFLFTDVEGSTKLLHELGAEQYAEALAEHRRVIREACAAEDGVEVDTQGDAFFFAFPTAPGALGAASAFTEVLASGPIQVRVGLHTGRPLLADEGYVGDDVHYAARVASSGHGGQVVLSKTTAAVVDVELVDLGEHRLKDIPNAVSIFQLGAGSFPPLKTISNTNLPHPASSFVGRDAELRQVTSRIAQGARLVTLTGPGGTGKTRLALEAALTLVPEYKAGVFWVGLASLRDPALVTETIAQSLGAKDGLADHISERELLLLLDNLEQVIDSAPELAQLLEACPNLTLLVTSRELLRVQGEVEYSVPPLAAPEAVELFCARAQLEPNDEVAELCARLDSLPLAVELAAARAKALSPTQILERLSGRLDLLKGGRDADPRQQTLRATIEWSYELLSPEEQELFARLSAFAGGCAFEAADEVCDAELETLQSLVEKSLIRFNNERYWMLETIREYAAERLGESQVEEETRRRHARCMEARYAELDRSNPASWVPAAEDDRDNLRAALRWALDAHEAESGLILANSYATLCVFHGPFAEGRAWLVAALEEGAAASPVARWRALNSAGGLAHRQADFEEATAYGEKALALARTMDDPQALGRSLRNLGLVVGSCEDFDRSDALQREALAVFSETGNDLEVRESLGMLAYLAIARGDLDSARSAIEDALARARDAGDQRGIQLNVSNLGHVLARLECFDEALEPLRESLLLAQERLEVKSVADQLLDMAIVAAGVGRAEDATVMLGGAEALYEATGSGFEPVGSQAHEQTLSTVRRELDSEVIAEAWRRGKGMTVDELVSYAVEFIDSRA